jgi:catechol 2,3-dioxygenase-like lactoylglutathione lyase family enzyme
VRFVGFDHVVINCSDVERSLEWYCGTLGLAGERVEQWRAGEAPFPSVRVTETTIIDLFSVTSHGGEDRTGDVALPPEVGEHPTVTGNMDHFCLVMEPADWEAMVASGVPPAQRGPSRVFGALGMGTSIYTRDPDGNLVELRCYPRLPLS